MSANTLKLHATQCYRPLGLVIITLSLTACFGEIPVKSATDNGYFADAQECRQFSEKKETMLLSNPTANTSVDIPLGYDSGKFINCMSYKGRPVPRANVSEYLEVSEHCLAAAHGAENSDEIYAQCVRNSELNVELDNE